MRRAGLDGELSAANQRLVGATTTLGLRPVQSLVLCIKGRYQSLTS